MGRTPVVSERGSLNASPLHNKGLFLSHRSPGHFLTLS